VPPGAGAAPLDLAFPAAFATLADRHILLDGEEYKRWTVSNSPPPAETRLEEGRLVRVSLPPSLEGKAIVLEARYQLVPGRTAEDGPLRSVFQPVTLPGLLTGVPTCWQVELPSGWVPLPLEGGAAFLRWGWHGWLLAPRPAATGADLIDWFRGDEEGLSLSLEDGGLVSAFD